MTAAGFEISIVPGAVTDPGGKPVTDEPGESPMLETRTDGPVFVTVDPASTE